MRSQRLFLVLFLSLFLSCPIHALTRQEALSWVRLQEGKRYDLDGKYGAQCSDLVSAYLNYLLAGDPHALLVGVYDACAYAKVLGLRPASFLILPPSQRPEPGDIFISKGTKTHGHTGIVLSCGAKEALILDQNSTQAGPDGSALLHSVSWQGSYELSALIRFRGFETEEEMEKPGIEEAAEQLAKVHLQGANELEEALIEEAEIAETELTETNLVEEETTWESLRILSCHKGHLRLIIHKAFPHGGTEIVLERKGKGHFLTRRTGKEELCLTLPRGETYVLSWRFYLKRNGTRYYTPSQGRLFVRVP